MKFKGLFTICLASAALFAANAQTHVEGREYYKADQLDNAKELLLRSLNNSQTDKAVSNYYLGMIAMDENKPAEAAQYFNAGIQADPDNGYNYVGKGYIALLNKDVKGAEAQFKQAEKLAKKDAGLEIAIARAYYEADPALYAKQITKAEEKARKYNMKSPEIYVFDGDVAKDNKDIGKAGSMYEMATSFDPTATAAYVKYANLFTMVKPSEAIRLLKKLLEVNPNSALGQRELANAYYNNNMFKEAAEEYGKYVNNPSHFKSDEDRYAFLLFYGGDYKKGYDYATKLLAANPDNFTARRFQFMNAAQIKDMESQLLPMAQALYQAHKANPTVNKMAPIDYTLVADEFDRAKLVDEAIDVLKDAMKENPKAPQFNKQLAIIYVDKNDLASAADAYKGYLEKTEEPTYNDYIQQALFLFYAGAQNKENKAKANQYYAEEEEILNKAAAAYPGFYKPNKMRGEIAIQKAEKSDVETAAFPYYSKAIEEFEAIEAPSAAAKKDAAEMYAYMANYYANKGNASLAQEYSNKAMQMK